MAGSGASKEEVQAACDVAANRAAQNQKEEAEWRYQEQKQAAEDQRAEDARRHREQMESLQQQKSSADERNLERLEEQQRNQQREFERKQQREFDRQDQMRRELVEEQRQSHEKSMEMLQQQSAHQLEFMQAQHAQDMENFRQQNAESIRQHQESMAALMKELDELKEEPFDPADPDRLMRKQGENFQKFCDAAKAHLGNVPKLKKTSIAVLGPSGVGKSTIINAFAGRKVTEVDVVECTQTISMVHASPEYDMYDVPGSRDERADFYNIDNLHKLKALHCILVVYTDRFEHVLNVAKLLRSIDIPHIFVRNKCNFVREADQLEKGYEKESASAGDVPLVYLGYADKEGDVPKNTDRLKALLSSVLHVAS